MVVCLNKTRKMIIIALILAIIGIISVTFGLSNIFFSFMSIEDPNNTEHLDKQILMASFNSRNSKKEDNLVLAYTKIPTYNQATSGYPLGCEGISLYMALKGLGYIKNYSIDEFMDTMPIGKTPFEGFMGNPKIGHVGSNLGKRTTIYPSPLAKWAKKYASSNDLTGASIDTLKKELDSGHVLVVFVTTAWKNPRWKKYSFSQTSLGEIENNHCLCVVGYRENGDFLINDCHDGRVDGRQGEYWISKEKFERIYNYRKYAISVY